MDVNDGVHTSHCCIEHGCKYGDKNCPVVNGKVKQLYYCENCNIENNVYRQYHTPDNKSLFNSYEIYNKEGSNLNHEFHTLVDDFITQKCMKFNTVQLKHILNDVINQSMLINIHKKYLKRKLTENEK